MLVADDSHEIVFHDQYKAELNVGTAVNTTLLVRTGCHLTAEATERGSPAPRQCTDRPPRGLGGSRLEKRRRANPRGLALLNR
jgi:hypothetical protein